MDYKDNLFVDALYDMPSQKLKEIYVELKKKFNNFLLIRSDVSLLYSQFNPRIMTNSHELIFDRRRYEDYEPSDIAMDYNILTNELNRLDDVLSIIEDIIEKNKIDVKPQL